jgi:hypothetical protein
MRTIADEIVPAYNSNPCGVWEDLIQRKYKV